MKFIYCDTIERTYLINFESICGIAVEVDLLEIASVMDEKEEYIIVDFTIDTTDKTYELKSTIKYNDDIHRTVYVDFQFAPAITKALYEFIEVKNFIDLKDVVEFAEREMCKNILQHKKGNNPTNLGIKKTGSKIMCKYGALPVKIPGHVEPMIMRTNSEWTRDIRFLEHEECKED